MFSLLMQRYDFLPLLRSFLSKKHPFAVGKRLQSHPCKMFPLCMISVRQGFVVVFVVAFEQTTAPQILARFGHNHTVEQQ